MESQVLYALKFNIIFISPLKFIDMIRIQKELTEDQYYLVQYFVEIC